MFDCWWWQDNSNLGPGTRSTGKFQNYEDDFLHFFLRCLLFFRLLFSSLHFSSLLFPSILSSSLLFTSLLFTSLLFPSILSSSPLFSPLLFSSLLFTSLHFSSPLFFSSLPFSSLLLFPGHFSGHSRYQPCCLFQSQRTSDRSGIRYEYPLLSTTVYAYLHGEGYAANSRRLPARTTLFVSLHELSWVLFTFKTAYTHFCISVYLLVCLFWYIHTLFWLFDLTSCHGLYRIKVPY